MHKYLEALSQIAEEKGGKLISQEYSGAHSKYKFIDEEGNEFEAPGYSIKSGRWSPHTAQKRKSQALLKYTIEDLKESARIKGGDCLSTEFKGYKHKYHWIDSKGRQFWKTYDQSELSNPRAWGYVSFPVVIPQISRCGAMFVLKYLNKNNRLAIGFHKEFDSDIIKLGKFLSDQFRKLVFKSSAS